MLPGRSVRRHLVENASGEIDYRPRFLSVLADIVGGQLRGVTRWVLSLVTLTTHSFSIVALPCSQRKLYSYALAAGVRPPDPV